MTDWAAQPPEFSPRDVVGLTWSPLLRALLGSLSRGVRLRGRQTIQPYVEGVGGT
jgi:hypothetical protein